MLAEPTVRVVGEADTVAEVASVLGRLRPHVVVTDLSGTACGPVIRRLRDLLGSTEQSCGLLVLVDNWRLGLLRQLPADVSRIHLRDATPGKLAATVRLLASGYVLVPKALSGLPGGDYLDQSLGELPASVTRREREVLELVAEGLTNAEIAAKLSVSESTVKSHIQHLVTKMGLRDRAALIIHVYRARLDL